MIESSRLTRCRFGGDPAWRWVAPNGVEFFLTQTRSRKWVWWREGDEVSSELFETREAIVAHLAQAFGEEN